MELLAPAQNTQVRFVGSPWARGKRWLLPTTLVFVLFILALSNLPLSRLATIVAIYLVQFLYASSLHARLMRSNVHPREAVHMVHRTRLVRLFIVFVVAQGAIVGLTGGLASPMTPLLVGPVVVPMTIFGRSRESGIVLAVAAVVAIAVAAIPSSFRPEIAQPYFAILSLGTVLATIVTIGTAVIGLSDGLAQTGKRLHNVCEGALEEQSVRRRDLESVGANVAHELKNPLAAIKGLLQLERARVVDERSRRRFDVMANEVSRMETILHDYLSFSRPFEPLRPVEVDLKGVVENVVALLEGRASSAKVDLRVEAQTVSVHCDPVRMKEALLNLAANAVEASTAGGIVTLTVEASGGVARLSIADSGVGMSAPVLERIGTPFFTTREEGTGLGVALARSIVSQHGGELSFESAPRRGTIARIAFPVHTKGGADGHDLARR
ncbi:hypothetical protein BH09MYX1_BH09MYX1_15070 [soil metagenome]